MFINLLGKNGILMFLICINLITSEIEHIAYDYLYFFFPKLSINIFAHFSIICFKYFPIYNLTLTFVYGGS